MTNDEMPDLLLAASFQFVETLKCALICRKGSWRKVTESGSVLP
jgi:hypothetical protein